MAEINLLKIIKEGTKAVPATKYAVGIAGLVAVVALIVSFRIDLRIALWGTLILIALMILLVIFAQLSQTASADFKFPVRILMWSFTIIFIAISILLTTSVFFKTPIDLQFFLLGNHSNENKKTEIETPAKGIDSLKEGNYKNVLGVSYMRLFGAGAVPYLMSIIQSKGIFKSNDQMAYKIKGKKNSWVESELANFWISKWEYKDAIPIRTALWNQYNGNIQAGFNLYWTSLKPAIGDIIEYTSHCNLNEIGEWRDNIPTDLKKENATVFG